VLEDDIRGKPRNTTSSVLRTKTPKVLEDDIRGKKTAPKLGAN